MRDTYDKELLKKLDDSSWVPERFSEGFIGLINEVERDVNSNSVSGKIASIFLKHQIIHSMTKDLINLSNIYLQGEIWPTRISPRYDGGKEQMTGWYIDYYENNCIDCRGKEDFIKEARAISTIRNKVAHNITGKNDVVINESYKKFEDHFKKAVVCYNDQCAKSLLWYLTDLTKRVDFVDLLSD